MNYRELVKLDEQFPELETFLFPSAQFGNQEFGTTAEILNFVRGYGIAKPGSKTRIRMMFKGNVNGRNAQHIYTDLRRISGKKHDVQWNFATKWLVGPNGEVERYDGSPNPLSLAPRIREMLASRKAKQDL